LQYYSLFIGGVIILADETQATLRGLEKKICFKQAGTTLLFSAVVVELIYINYYENCYSSFRYMLE